MSRGPGRARRRRPGAAGPGRRWRQRPPLRSAAARGREGGKAAGLRGLRARGSGRGENEGRPERLGRAELLGPALNVGSPFLDDRGLADAFSSFFFSSTPLASFFSFLFFRLHIKRCL